MLMVGLTLPLRSRTAPRRSVIANYLRPMISLVRQVHHVAGTHAERIVDVVGIGDTAPEVWLCRRCAPTAP
jgi:hypothetical protein